jgi:CRISPR-associated protein Cas5t
MAMDVLRITCEGMVTSFRYPYFNHGVQPTYEMPPLATLYGHVCSALGDWFAPDECAIGFDFTHQGKFVDYEHTHLFGRKGEAKLSPFERELLFQPRLTFYLTRTDWLGAFLSPRYVVTLGRSQDLMRYADVRVVTLQETSDSYVAQTLVPLADSTPFQQTVALTLPHYVSPERQTVWGQYAWLKLPQAYHQPAWVDRTRPLWHSLPRAVWWHKWQ